MVEPSQTNAVAALLMRHTDTLYGYILACLRNRHDADDVLQSVAVVIVGAADAPTEDEGFLRWAREIARRRILEFHRVNGRMQVLDPHLVQRLADAAEWAGETRAALDRREALLKCVEKLPADAREVLLHRYGERQLSMEQIAVLVGRSVDGITSYLYRVRAALRNCVDRRLTAEGRP